MYIYCNTKHIHITIVTVEKQEILHILSVCF